MTWLSVLRGLADLGSAVLAVTLYVTLPFGTVANAVISAAVFFALGWFIDRTYQSRLTPDERAAELKARNDADL